MSLINDMLKDLEARKAPLRREEPPPPEEMRHPDVTPPIERKLRRRLPWLLGALSLALLGMALYLLWQAPGLLTRQAPPLNPVALPAAGPLQAARQTPAASPRQAEEPAPAAPATAEAGQPRLRALSAIEHEGGLRLELTFDRPLPGPLTLSRTGGRVELQLPGATLGPLGSPHPRLSGWQSEATKEGGRIAFDWPSAADIRLIPPEASEGGQRWQILLAAAPPHEAAAKPPAPQTPAQAQLPTQAPAAPSPAPQAPRPSPGLSPAKKAEALYSEAWQLQQKGRLDLALEKLDQALKLDPQHARARELRVRLLLRAGLYPAAESELLQGLSLDPRQPELVELLARLLADQGRLPQALQLLRERMQPGRLSHQALYAALAARAGQHAEAAEAYRRAAALDARDPRWPLGLAIALENSGQKAQAAAAYAQALALDGLDDASRAFAEDRLHALGGGG